MYPYTIASVSEALVELGLIFLGVLIAEGIIVKLYDRWKGASK